MSLQTNDFSSQPTRILSENHENTSANVASSSMATCSSASTSSEMAAPAADTTPPVKSSSAASAALTSGPMVASQASTNFCQIACSFRSRRTMFAKVWFTSASSTSSGSQFSSAASSTQYATRMASISKSSWNGNSASGPLE